MFNHELHKKLLTLDPRRAALIDAKNPVRLIRAIEIATINGPVSPVTTSSPYNVLYIGLKTDSTVLKERITLRLTKRIKTGMLAEFARVHEAGLSWKRMEELGLEYRYGARLLQKEMSREEFMTQLTSEIYKYAKRQMTWFKRNKDIHWIEVNDAKTALTFVERFLDKK